MDKEEKRALKEASKQQRKEEKAANAAEMRNNYGDEVLNKPFAFSTVTLYSKGYVRVKGGFGLIKSAPQKLIAIDYSADITKKTGLGRASAAVLTGGLNLLSSNKRGDAYLTIVTDVQTHSLRSEGPTAMELSNGQALASTGRALIGASDSGVTIPTDDSDIADQLQKLTKLHKAGALTDEEFAAAKARILG